MNFLDISPYVFGDGGLTWYSVFVLTGALLVLIISNYLYKKDPESKKCPDLIFDIFLVGFPMGLVGARIWFVLSELDYYLENPLSILKVWEGGLAIQGGVILGAICGIWMAHHLINKHGIRLKITKLMDMIIPNILLAQVVGRWGNFFNREVYGACVSREDIWFIPDFIANNMKGGFIGGVNIECATNEFAQPLFLYEGLLNLLGFILISILLRKFFTKRVDGTLTGLYLIYYGTVRACLEGLRNEEFIMRWGSVSQSLVTSIVYIVLGVLFIGYVYLQHYGVFNKFKKNKVLLADGVDNKETNEINKDTNSSLQANIIVENKKDENVELKQEVKEEIKQESNEAKIETKSKPTTVKKTASKKTTTTTKPKKTSATKKSSTTKKKTTTSKQETKDSLTKKVGDK